MTRARMLAEKSLKLALLAVSVSLPPGNPAPGSQTGAVHIASQIAHLEIIWLPPRQCVSRRKQAREGEMTNLRSGEWTHSGASGGEFQQTGKEGGRECGVPCNAAWGWAGLELFWIPQRKAPRHPSRLTIRRSRLETAACLPRAVTHLSTVLEVSSCYCEENLQLKQLLRA